MADLTGVAGEVLDNGYKTFVQADMGAFTAQSLVFDGGVRHEDNSSGRRVGTYATPIRDGDPVKVKTGKDDQDLFVERMAASDNGDLFYGLYVEWRAQAGDIDHDSVIYVPGDGDRLIFEATDGAISVGDAVSLASDSYDADRVHGFRVTDDNTNGFGYARQASGSSGDEVTIELRSGR